MQGACVEVKAKVRPYAHHVVMLDQPPPLTLDELVMLYIAVTRMLEDRDPFTMERYEVLCALHDQVRAHASKVAGRPLRSFDLVGWFRTTGA